MTDFCGCLWHISLGEIGYRKINFWHEQLVLHHIDELRSKTYTVGKLKSRPFDPTKNILVAFLSSLIAEAFSNAPSITSPLGKRVQLRPASAFCIAAVA